MLSLDANENTKSWIISLENLELNIPEDIFLLDSVRQIATGVDAFSDKHPTKDVPKLLYLNFIFKHRSDKLYIVFEKNEECLLFLDKINQIVDDEMDNASARLFILVSQVHRGLCNIRIRP